jgi:xanthine dehydrogenase accessory factor
MRALYEAILRAYEEDRPVALCTVIRARGSVPRHEAAKMLVHPDGRIQGTIGGGEMEARVIQEALHVIQEGHPRLVRYTLSDPLQGDPGVCGGEVEIFIEPLLPPAVLIIGAGHVGRALAHLAKWLGFRVLVSDDRPELCTPEWIPEADRFFVGPPEEVLPHAPIHPQTYIVLTTRNHPLDVRILPLILDSPAPYIGVIGSRRRWLLTAKALMERGIPLERLARVRSPVGLELRAETPEEIAVSIMAEIIAVRRGGSGAPMTADIRELLREAIPG